MRAKYPEKSSVKIQYPERAQYQGGLSTQEGLSITWYQRGFGYPGWAGYPRRAQVLGSWPWCHPWCLTLSEDPETEAVGAPAVPQLQDLYVGLREAPWEAAGGKRVSSLPLPSSPLFPLVSLETSAQLLAVLCVG